MSAIGFQEMQTLLVNATYVTMFVLAVLFVLLVIAHVVTLIHLRSRKRYLEEKRPQLQCAFRDLLADKSSGEKLSISATDRKFCKEVMIEELAGKSDTDRQKLRGIYKQLGYYDEDLNQLKDEWRQRVRALERLEKMGFTEAEEQVFPLLKDPSVEVRFAALKMLAVLGSSRLAETLPKVFEENSSLLFNYLLNILSQAQISTSSLKALAASPSREAKRAAAFLLGRSQDDEAVALLKELAGMPEGDIRREAVRSLAGIGTPGAISVLAEKASDPDAQVRLEEAVTLGRVKNPDALPVLRTLADDKDFDVRIQAFAALAALGGRGSDVIKELEGKYPDTAKEFLEVKKDAALVG